MKYRILQLLFTALLFECRPTEEVEYNQYDTKVAFELAAIHIFHNGNILVVGGNVWNNSFAIRSNDEGLSWTQFDLQGRGLFALSTEVTDHVYACGIDKKIYSLDTSEHSIVNFNEYLAFKAIDLYDSSNIMLVGGESIGLGYIYKANLSKPSIELSLGIPREMNVIHCIDSLHWIAAGFGIVLRTDNGGIQWDTLPVYGEHFLDICFIDQSKGYLCGIGGSIYKTLDGGLNWKTIRNAKSFFVSDQPFRCICFKDAFHGLVAGESGIVWRTEDGGEHWKIIDNLPKVDFLDIQWSKGRYWLCGSEGTVISLL